MPRKKVKPPKSVGTVPKEAWPVATIDIKQRIVPDLKKGTMYLNPLYIDTTTEETRSKDITDLRRSIRASTASIEKNNSNARCTIRLKTKRRMRNIFIFILMLHITFIIASALFGIEYIRKRPIGYVFSTFQFTSISIMFVGLGGLTFCVRSWIVGLPAFGFLF